MSEVSIFNFDGPDEGWVLTLVNSKDMYRVYGRFVMNALGKPIWFQTIDGKVYFIPAIVSAQRQKPINN